MLLNFPIQIAMLLWLFRLKR